MLLKTENSGTIGKLISSLFLAGILAVVPLPALPIDVASAELTVTLPAVESLELYGFRPNTITVIQVTGAASIEWVKQGETDSPPVILGKNSSSILIENEQQLTDKDIVTVKVHGAIEDIQLVKRVIRTDQYPNLGNNEKWVKYVDAVRDYSDPSRTCVTLAELTEGNLPKRVLVLGCGSGRDALFWMKRGSQVSVEDGTPHAIGITCLRFAEIQALDLLEQTLASNLEVLPDEIGTFDAVTACNVFAFLPAAQFTQVMTEKVFTKIAPGGYFAGDFFGEEHGWSQAHVGEWTFLTRDQVIELFVSNGFEIVWMDEVKRTQTTVFDGQMTWHSYLVVARKLLKD